MLKHDKGWTRTQRKQADEKVRAISEAAARGELKKTNPVRSMGARARYEHETGRRIQKGQDLDHTIDLQLGGLDHVSNMTPIDSTVNRSIGSQISAQLGVLEDGAKIAGAAIC